MVNSTKDVWHSFEILTFLSYNPPSLGRREIALSKTSTRMIG